MHVMAIKMQPYLVPELATMPDIQLTVLGDSSYSADVASLSSVREVIPYKTRSKLDLRAIRCIRDAVIRCRPDVIHAFYGRALANTIMATTGIRHSSKIVSFRGITSPPTLWDPANWLSYRHRRVDAHACESDAVRDVMVASGLTDESCFTTYNCVPMNAYASPGRAALAQFDIPSDAFVVATVATMRPVKGIDLLLRAAIESAGTRDIWWLLMGAVKDPRIPRLAADERIRDRVRMTGHRTDAASLISGADVFVLPSRAEALSVALLEAMLQGVCPLVSDAGGMKELVRHSQDGLVVPRENVTKLSQAIQHLYDHRSLTRQYGDSAAERVRNFASPTRMAERVTSLYQHVLKAA